MASIEEAVRHLEAVTTEIELLRDSVASHRQATLGLEAIASSLGTLSIGLDRLPAEVLAEFAGVAELVEQLRRAFLPAGALHVSLTDLSHRVDQAASEAKVATAQFREELDTTRTELRDLRSLVIEGQRDLGETVRAVQSDLTALNGLARRGFWDLLRGKSAARRAFDAPLNVSERSPESGLS